jgi:hypothetical protein
MVVAVVTMWRAQYSEWRTLLLMYVHLIFVVAFVLLQQLCDTVQYYGNGPRGRPFGRQSVSNIRRLLLTP